ncbi:hypothetical protein DYBT9275_01198 [Dyadobacter sp. CECT 9275]|uniref:Peptidase M14 domain-containing protein n=1 Tax=Dyadobacter helix TaxID=2822344 RepID=A0A916JAT9_9BACT|nr:M14 family zinc carboxypeptidase [Dyadobacter sp. CECT 9275]CAG4993601.1 hypothetical protein DYBT9275_01198 [Dyadobacter sp. CECT 9275]
MIQTIRLLAFLLFTHTVFAQQLTPDQFLGYAMGTRFTYHHQIIEYFKYTAGQYSDRVKIIQYGTTQEGRPLMAAFISSPENIARLENIRTNHLKSIRLQPGNPDAPTPPIVWLSYNIHGNEAVSAHTSMKVLYELLNPSNKLTQEIIKNTVIIIDPCSNPDGYERYISWYNRSQNATPDLTPFALEHDEPWPGGRYNHYLFDLNRDWAWQTQLETKARIELYNQWMPHLHADFHEMTSNASYYFPPAAKPLHKDITAWQRQFNERIGEYCRKYFDENNWTYFTRNDYDLFYPSYGDTWPTYNGAIGMTFEQGGGGKAGLGIERKNENDTLTLATRIAHHYATSMATLEAIYSSKEKVVSEFIKFHENAASNPTGNYKTYVVKTAGNTGRIRAFAEYLGRQGFTYGTAGKDFSAKGTNLTAATEETIKIESNDLVISAFQPKSNLLRILFEPKPVLEDSITYDITSWGLAYLFGLKAYGIKEKITPISFQPSELKNKVPANPPYAYLARWSEVEDAVFLSALLKKKILVRSSNVPFEMDKQHFEAGTLIITKKGNEQIKLDEIVTSLADKHHIRLIPVSTGFVTHGPDFGNNDVVSLKQPKIVALAGDDISPTALGEVWHYFEQQIGYPLTLVNAERLSALPLHEVDVLILPDGRYAKIIGDRMIDALQEWVRNGGKIVALERATDLFLNKPGFGLTKKSAERRKETDVLKKFGNQEREEAGDSSPGSMYQITFDNTHPISFGCSKEYFTLVREAYERDYLKEGWNVGYLLDNNYKAGFVGIKMAPKLKNTLMIGVQPMGLGEVVYLMDNPLFRGMLYNGKVLFSNIIFR